MLGWGLGKLSSSFIVSWDHWLGKMRISPRCEIIAA
ncbi:MAG: hypothetical protein CL584_03565 [Alteromonadaceae bacterium]|nr:hypothetical protein [Alteromonadaceae bacterium]